MRCVKWTQEWAQSGSSCEGLRMKKVWVFFPKFTGTLVKGVPLGWGWGRQHDCVWHPRKMDD